MAKKKYESINIDTMSQNVTIDSSNKNALDFGEKTWSNAIKTVAAVGDDLVITTKSEGSYTVTLKNYFAKNGKHPIKFIKTADEVNGERSIIDYVNMENIYGKAQIITGNDTLKGTVFNDTITGGVFRDKIYGYGGDDTIDGGAGNDYIKGGAGENTVLLYTTKKFGNDTIELTKGEYLVLKLADATNMDAVTTELVGKDLVITVNKGGEYESTVTVKNYTKKDVITDAGSFILVDKNGSLLFDFREDYYVETYMDNNEGHFAGKTFNGTWLNDDVNAEDYKAKDKQGNVITTNTDKVKGVTINLGNAPEMNMAHGSIYADKIKGGAGSDDIFGGKGNDVITGGKGLNYVHYVKGDGADVINLTKGEYFVLKFDNTGDENTLTREDLKFAYVNNKKDLKLYYLDDNGNEAGSVTLKNFAKKDVTNNATKKTSDTSEVMVQFGDSQPIDLRDTLIHSYVNKANFTGGWLRDYIDASNSDELFKKGKHKNMVLNGGKGDDKIVGSRYTDTLKGGVGDDELEGGKGNDLLYGEAGKNTFVFNSGDGVDTVYSGKGIDTLKFVGEDNGQALVSFEVGENNRDLYVRYGMNRSSYVIVKDYYDKKGNLNSKCSVKYLQFGNQIVDIETAREQAETDFKDIAMFDKSGDIVATANTQYIITRDGTDDNIDLTPSTKSDVSVNSKSGNDTIIGRTDTNVNYTITGTDGDKNITTGKGNDKIEIGDGNHNINAGLGNNTITAGDNTSTENKGVISTGYNDDTITVGDGGYEIYTTGGNNIITAGDGNNVISENPENSYSVGKNVITTGSGDDNIYIKGYGAGTTINAGNGDNIIHYDDYGTNTGINNGSAKITTGSGDDSITIGGYYKDTTDWACGTTNNTVNAGDGNNTVTIGHTSTHDNTVETGSGNDTITTFGYNNTITAGGGVNTVTIEGNNAYGNKVTTGSGDDTITLGNGYNTEDEENWNIIKAGDGANVITGGSGTFDITVGDSTITDTEDPNYNKGSEITLGRNGYYNQYTTITAGSGDDTVEFKGYLYNSEINLGEGDNTMIARSEAGHTNISTGSGDDTLTLEGSFYGENKDNRNTIDLGSGKNTVTTEYITYTDITTTGSEKQILTFNNMGEYVNISTGTGDDEINVSSYGYNSTITTTGGNNKITYGDNMNGWGGSSHNEDNHYGKITTGSGNDEITIGTFDEEGNTLGGVQGTIINAGDGENVIKVADECYYTQITTGKDKDIITVGAKSGGNIINAGDGDNEVYLAKDGQAYGSYSITTGSGNDTIVVGDDSYNSTKTIDAGAGKNTITVGGVYYGVDITTTGNEVQNITVGKEDYYNAYSTISTGSGDDIITLIGEFDGADIKSAGGDNKIENLDKGSDHVTITTGSGDDNLNFAGYNSKIFAGAGDNTIVATNTGNTIETGDGKDDITLGDNSNDWASNVVNIGHEERDVKGEWNDEIEDYDYTHEQALEGGVENTVTIKGQYRNTINIYNTQTVEGKYNTVKVEGTGGRHTINITDGHAKVDLGTTSENTVTTGNGDDIITVAGDGNTINAGGGDNIITVSGESNEINTASGKDIITYTGGDSGWDNAEINIGHEERDVFDHLDGDEQIYKHEQAVEGGVENTVTLDSVYNANVNIYNTSTEEGKYNTINVTGASERIYINVTDGHTKVNFNTELERGSSDEITTGSGDDEITGFLLSTIDAGDGDNTVTMREYQNGYSSYITTGSGKDKIDVYDYADIKTGAGDDIINAHVVDSEYYGGDDPENRGNYNITASMGAGNDVLNIDEGFKGGLYLNLKLGDGSSNTINGITDSISSIYIDIDPNCEYYVRPSASDNTDLEIVLIENGTESGDVMTLKGVLKNQADHEPITHDIYINGSNLGGMVDDNYKYYVPTSKDFIINGNHSMSGEISGTEGDDVIYGSDGNDIIKPLYGDDIIRPGKGDDIIDLESNYGRKSIHFNIGDGNLTIQNTLPYTVSLYMEGVESGDFTIEKQGKDYCIVRSNGETVTFKDLYDDEGYMGYNNVYIYDKDGNGYNYIGAFANDSKIDKPIHIYAPEDAEGYELVADYYSKSIFHVSDNVVSIVTHGDSDVVIYGMPYEEGHSATQVKMEWSSSYKFSRYVREGDDLVIKTVYNEDYFYTDEEALWADWNMRTTTIVDFFKEHNKVDYFIFGDRGLTYDSIVAEAMTQAVNKTTDDGETLTKPQDDDWWMGSYTYNAGDGNDTIIATGNADIAYGNGGDDDIYMYNPDNLEEYGASGLFDGGEGNDTYYVKFAPSGTHTIIADKGQDSLVIANAKDTYGGINFDVNDTSTYEMTTDGKDIVLTSNDYYIDNEFVIKDALFKKIDLTISDTVNSLSLKDMMEANNIYVSSYQTDPESLYGSIGNDIMYAQEDCSNVYGFAGSDTIYAFGDKNVYTLGGGEPGSNGFKDTQIGTVDRVELYGRHNTVYAQSETNIINSYNDDSYWENSVLVKSTDDYFAYLDQSTTINDAYGNDSLTIMNTYLTEDGQYEIGGMQNLYIMCDFGDNYSGDFDLLLFNNANLLKWQNGNDMDEDSSNDPRGIRIKYYSGTYNKIETITTADGYTITSEQIAELADSISNWMYYGNDGNQYFGSMDELRTAEHQSDMNLLVQYVQEQAATMWTQG